MREYILTEQEKQIIKKYLETGEKLEGFRMLLSRCGTIETVNSDLELIKQFLARAGAKTWPKATSTKKFKKQVVFGENIWKILNARYVVDQQKRFGKMQPKQNTEWDARRATQKQVTNQVIQWSTPQFLFQAKNLSSKNSLCFG